MKQHVWKRILSILLVVALSMTFVSCFLYEEVEIDDPDAQPSATSEDTTDSEEQSEQTSVVIGEDESGVVEVSATSENSKTTSAGTPSKSTSDAKSQTSQSTGNGNLVLVEKGKANCKIVVAKKADEEVVEAAEDLQDYLERITGAQIKIITDDKDCTNGNYILVGPSAYTKKIGITTPTGYPGTEKLIVKRVKNYLALLGNDSGNYTGTAFAVTYFLEKLGCGWYGPQELWQVVPSLKDISVGSLNVTQTPKFTTRINNVYTSYRGVGMRWYMGGDNMMTGHGIPGLVPKTTFETHPEWYSMINGKRNVDAGYWQYCYSNEALAKEVGNKIIEYFDKHPEMVSYPLAQNDGWETYWCECENCSKYPNRSDLMILFGNRVAKVVAKKYPSKRICLLSYHATLLKPTLSTKVEPNVEIMFCVEGTNITQPANSTKFNKGYDGMSHMTISESWADNFNSYISKTGAKTTSIWKWYCIAVERPEWKDVPWVQGNVAIEDQNYWKSKGVKYVFYDQGPLAGYREGSSSFALRWPLWYVAAKGAWDSSLTGDQILADACNKLYGKAGNAMLKYYQALATASKECESYSNLWIPPAIGAIYTSTQVKRIDATVKAAEALKGQLTAEQKERMEKTFEYWAGTKLLVG